MFFHYIKKAFTYFSNPLKAKYFLFLMDFGYLYERGWINSFLKSKVVDKYNQPLPWLSYPAIDFLKQSISETSNIFEYGAGNSTLYFSKHYQSVTTVENNPDWYEYLKKCTSGKENCTLLLAQDKEEYVKSISAAQKKFDAIIVDGRWRAACLKEALWHLEKDGLLILDDADRVWYQEAIEQVKKSGFYPILFRGMSALSFEDHTTLVFKKFQ
jgi:hypothetical protein